MAFPNDQQTAARGAAPFREAWSEDGEPRAHWRHLMEAVDALGAPDLASRQAKVTRILRDDGATFALQTDPRSFQTWRLDPVPLVLDSEQWNAVEAGIRERAELLNLVLADLYGERELLKAGVVPPELLFSHGGFLRACTGIRLPGEQQLPLYAADVVRDPDGGIRVLADRTQVIGGLGYALENRTVISRVLPSLFRDSHVHRLSVFFQTMRRKLVELADNARARIVMLTPGPYSRHFFEQAYLASYLGIALVQGGDLTVRRGAVFAKTLSGLERVDVIVRGIEDVFCDPVELQANSVLGVPGLLEAARSGTVRIVNPLGSGLLEGSAFARYLPAIAAHFLGRQPRLRTAPTWWCGEPADLEFVRANLARLVVKRVAQLSSQQSIFAGTLSEDELTRLKFEIERAPWQYVAQDIIQVSHAPTLVDGVLAERPAVLRVFAVAADTSYSVMPGGLARVGATEDEPRVDPYRGAVSKDTWILASEPEKQLSLMRPAERGQDVDTDVSGRVVENLFWFARYAERAEFSMRYLRTVFVALNDPDQSPDVVQRLLHGVARVTATGAEFSTAHTRDAWEAEVYSVLVDRERVGSLAWNVGGMLRAANEVRDRFSSDTQRILNDISDELGQLAPALEQGLMAAPEEALDPLITDLLALAGLGHESLVRGTAWQFLELGRRLERALQIVALLRELVVPFDETNESVVLTSVLVALESLMSYRRRHRGEPLAETSLTVALLDSSNPRSLIFQLERLQAEVDALRAPESDVALTPESRLVLEAATNLKLAAIGDLCRVDEHGRRPELDQLLSRLQHLLEQMADHLTGDYFDRTEEPQPLVVTRGQSHTAGESES